VDTARFGFARGDGVDNLHFGWIHGLNSLTQCRLGGGCVGAPPTLRAACRREGLLFPEGYAVSAGGGSGFAGGGAAPVGDCRSARLVILPLREISRRSYVDRPTRPRRTPRGEARWTRLVTPAAPKRYCAP